MWRRSIAIILRLTWSCSTREVARPICKTTSPLSNSPQPRSCPPTTSILSRKSSRHSPTLTSEVLVSLSSIWVSWAHPAHRPFISSKWCKTLSRCLLGIFTRAHQQTRHAQTWLNLSKLETSTSTAEVSTQSRDKQLCTKPTSHPEWWQEHSGRVFLPNLASDFWI